MHDQQRRDVDALPPSAHQANTPTGGSTGFGVTGGDIIVSHDRSKHLPATRGTAESSVERVRILLFAANPNTTPRAALEEEVHEITEKLRLAQDRDVFELTTCWAVRPADLLQQLNQHRPHIVHFSGRGDSAGEIVLSADGGGEHRVSAEALAELFRTMNDDIRIVVLNACDSTVQAEAISRHIDFIVGLRAPVEDRSAAVFAAAFYSAMGFHRTVQEAFDQATTALMLHGLPDHHAPELIVRSGANPHTPLYNVTTTASRPSDDGFGVTVSALVAADIDLNVLVDGVLTLRVDHSGGFDYAAATMVVRPSSVISFQAPGLSIDRRASQIVDNAEKKLHVRVGTDTRANIPITAEQRRAAMGTPDDVPSLIDVLTHRADRSARAWAATRLGAIGDRRAVAPLVAVVDGVRPDQDQSSEWVQSQAALALAELGDPAGAPAIQRALDQLPNRDHYAHLFEEALRNLAANR